MPGAAQSLRLSRAISSLYSIDRGSQASCWHTRRFALPKPDHAGYVQSSPSKRSLRTTGEGREEESHRRLFEGFLREYQDQS